MLSDLFYVFIILNRNMRTCSYKSKMEDKTSFATFHAKYMIYNTHLAGECAHLCTKSCPSMQTFWRQDKLAAQLMRHEFERYDYHTDFVSFFNLISFSKLITDQHCLLSYSAGSLVLVVRHNCSIRTNLFTLRYKPREAASYHEAC